MADICSTPLYILPSPGGLTQKQKQKADFFFFKRLSSKVMKRQDFTKMMILQDGLLKNTEVKFKHLLTSVHDLSSVE